MQKIKEVISKLVKSTSERLEGKFDGSISNGRCQKLRESSPKIDERRRFFRSFDEYTFLICTLCFSTSIVFLKVLYANRDVFRKLYTYTKKMFNTWFSIPDFALVTRLSAFFASIWSIIVDLNWLFIPALVGIATTFITWRFVYWDSKKPGIMPPSPFSPKTQLKKLKLLYIGSSGYTFAMYIGMIVFVILVTWGVLST